MANLWVHTKTGNRVFHTHRYTDDSLICVEKLDKFYTKEWSCINMQLNIYRQTRQMCVELSLLVMDSCQNHFARSLCVVSVCYALFFWRLFTHECIKCKLNWQWFIIINYYYQCSGIYNVHIHRFVNKYYYFCKDLKYSLQRNVLE